MQKNRKGDQDDLKNNFKNCERQSINTRLCKLKKKSHEFLVTSTEKQFCVEIVHGVRKEVKVRGCSHHVETLIREHHETEIVEGKEYCQEFFADDRQL